MGPLRVRRGARVLGISTTTRLQPGSWRLLERREPLEQLSGMENWSPKCGLGRKVQTPREVDQKMCEMQLATAQRRIDEIRIAANPRAEKEKNRKKRQKAAKKERAEQERQQRAAAPAATQAEAPATILEQQTTQQTAAQRPAAAGAAANNAGRKEEGGPKAPIAVPETSVFSPATAKRQTLASGKNTAMPYGGKSTPAIGVSTAAGWVSHSKAAEPAPPEWGEWFRPPPGKGV
jgi:TolA-binding protein